MGMSYEEMKDYLKQNFPPETELTVVNGAGDTVDTVKVAQIPA